MGAFKDIKNAMDLFLIAAVDDLSHLLDSIPRLNRQRRWSPYVGYPSLEVGTFAQGS